LQSYKDANHKPEMALALSEFEALCSFVPHEELLAAFDAVPEMAACCGPERVAAYRSSSACSLQRRQALSDAFHAVMACPPECAAACVRAVCERLTREAAAGRQLSPRELLTLRLQQQYPGDVGVLASWFLNYLRLQPGQAVALAANEPHAYISGEIIECMATSGAWGLLVDCWRAGAIVWPASWIWMVMQQRTAIASGHAQRLCQSTLAHCCVLPTHTSLMLQTTSSARD
jgi:mannose-6-phosphate isomerase